MVEKAGVIDAAAPTAEEERLKNLQAEYSRKLDKVNEEMTAKFEALAQKLDGLTREEAPPPIVNPGAGVNEKEELLKISARPRGYVEDIVSPLKEKAAALEKELLEQRQAVVYSQWQRIEDRIARAEGKKDYTELPEEFTKAIRQEIINRGWQQNPSAGMDAYELVKAKKVNLEASDPDRIRRINAQGEGSGRGAPNRSNLQTITNGMMQELASTPPSHPDYKKNMETLDKVQRGFIKIEG